MAWTMPDTAEDLKEFMRRFPQGVTVVTAKGPIGTTVSSFISVSLSPPLILIALDNNSRTGKVIRETSLFAVNLLSEEMASISETFAHKPHAERFLNIPHLFTGNGLPIINGIIGYMECKLRDIFGAGDHTLYLGEVLSARVLSDKLPLVYHMRRYTGVRA
jgi:flavin reductase (DIM6/NTAB) family NADH-FMN oxidoreductase RutF